VSSSGTPPTTRGIGASTSPHIESSSLITSSSTSWISPFSLSPPLPLSPSSTCSSILPLCPPLSPPSLQVRSPCLPARPRLRRSPPHSHVRPRRPQRCLRRPRWCHPPSHGHVRPRRLLRRHVRPRRPLRRLTPPHRCQPPRTATCGLDVSRIASTGPVVSLHQPHPDVPAPWSSRCTASPRADPPGLSPRHRPLGPSPHPPDGHPARGGCPPGPRSPDSRCDLLSTPTADSHDCPWCTCRSAVAACHGRGIRRSPGQPHLGPGAASPWHQCGCMPIKLKLHADGSLERYKARYVLRGFT
jgi:hypothetical protein